MSKFFLNCLLKIILRAPINETHHILTMSSIMHKQLKNLNLRHFRCKHNIYILVKFQTSWQQIDLTFDVTRIHYLLVGINNND